MIREYLNPKQSLDIEPAADRNVERITECCLDASPKMSHFLGKGRGGGAWWMIWMGVFGSVPFLLVGIYTNDFLNGFLFFVFIAAFFGVSLLWPIHVWKNHYPIRFSRKTHKVYCHWSGKTYIEDWDTIKAYLQTKLEFNAHGAPSQTPQINIEFHNDDGSVAEHSVIGVDKGGLGYDEQAAAFWEYIRRYMEEGAEHLPMPDSSHEFGDNALKELREQYKLFPLWKGEVSLLTKLFNVVIILPFAIVWVAISYPTEVIYYFLEKHVKTNPFPPEMEAACRCDEAVKVWYPKQNSIDEAA
jgi:hypothetical protein